eukprot:m.18464 g.18464  ORF g.18464 m.18464 type:complete len:54 (+) comp12035_c0_seq1:952-1113(+)
MSASRQCCDKDNHPDSTIIPWCTTPTLTFNEPSAHFWGTTAIVTSDIIATCIT